MLTRADVWWMEILKWDLTFPLWTPFCMGCGDVMTLDMHPWKAPSSGLLEDPWRGSLVASLRNAAGR